MVLQYQKMQSAQLNPQAPSEKINKESELDEYYRQMLKQ